jgi:hypothetical protein
MAKTVEDFIVDFAKAEDSGGGNPRVKNGTYKVRILSAKPVTSGQKDTPGLEVTMAFLGGKYDQKKFKDTLWATPKAYSRFRTLLEACGKKVPAKVQLAKIAAAIKGSELFIEIDKEAPREGYTARSRVTFEGFIHVDDADDLDDDDTEDDDDVEEDDEDIEDDDEDDEDDEDEEPAPKKKAKKKSKKVDDDEDDEDDEDIDDLDLEDL